MKSCCPQPSAYPTDEMQCCIDCANGTCKEPLADQIWAHQVVIQYAAAQAQANPQPCPCPCPCCSWADAKTLHAALKGGGKAAGPFNWLALIQLLIPALLQLLSLLNPQPAPTPAP